MAEGVHPEPKRVWSLGTTILQEQTQKRCVCAFDENGNIYYEAMEVGARENIPPGTPITRTSYSWRVSDGDGGVAGRRAKARCQMVRRTSLLAR